MKTNIDIALLLIRVALGAVFVAHGWDKITDIAGTVGFFDSLGLPAFTAYLIAGIEFLGGIALFLGVFTGWASILIAATMLGAMSLVKLKDGFVGGYEFDLVLFLSAIAIALAGPGLYTLKGVYRKARD